MIGALIFLGVLSIGAAAMWKQLHMRMEGATRFEHQQQAHYLAEAGVEKAIVMLRQAPDEYRGEQDTPLGDGQFSVYVEPKSDDRRFLIKAQGEVSFEGQVRARQSLQYVLRR